jgi:hypothetical protein
MKSSSMLSYPAVFISVVICFPFKVLHRACGVNDNACMIFAFENRSYLGEFEAEFKKALACGVNETACIKKSNIFANSNLYSKRL